MNITPDNGTDGDEYSLSDGDPTQPSQQSPQYEYSCEVCGTELHYGGRGRKPRFCDEHKRSNRSASSGGRSSGKNIDTLISQIQDIYLTIGVAAGAIPPLATDSLIIASNAQRMAESWRPLIERDPKIRKFWERITTGGGWGTVVLAHGTVALALMQAHNVSLPGFASQAVEGVNRG